MIAELGNGRWTPFEVRYRNNQTGARLLKGLAAFCSERKVERAYVITKDIRDVGVVELGSTGTSTPTLNIPAALACDWLGRSELEANESDDDA